MAEYSKPPVFFEALSPFIRRRSSRFDVVTSTELCWLLEKTSAHPMKDLFPLRQNLHKDVGEETMHNYVGAAIHWVGL